MEQSIGALHCCCHSDPAVAGEESRIKFGADANRLRRHEGKNLDASIACVLIGINCRAGASPAPATEAVDLQLRRVQMISDLLQEALDFLGLA